jgi:hypothetical protein
MHNIPLDNAKAYLDQLDLSYLINTLCAKTYALPRWSEIEATHCAQLYKNFLWLNKKHLPMTLVPTREIDEFWHNHILHTKNYMHDCLKIFGHYFHHTPALPTEDLKALSENYLKTKELYLVEFGHALGLIKT